MKKNSKIFGNLTIFNYLSYKKNNIFKKADNLSVNKFNIYFLKKVTDLFCGLIKFLYL